MEKASIPYWLDSGLLLTIRRDQTIGDHLKHMTLGISSEHYTLLRECLSSKISLQVREVMDKSGFEWINFPVSKVIVRPAFKIHGFSVSLEIMIKVKNQHTYRWVSGITCKEMEGKFYSHCESIFFHHHSFPVPGSVDSYLAIRYSEWKNPILTWDSNFDDGARITLAKVRTLNRKSRIHKTRQFKKNYLTGKFLKQTESVLFEITAFLEKNHIRYWLDFGTLLGIYRDQSLIPWDNDADISIHSEDVHALLNVQHQLPFKYRLSPRYNSSRWLPGKYRVFKLKYWYQKPLRLVSRKELYIDIFVKYKVGDYFYWMGTGTPKRVKAGYHDRLESIAWKNKAFSIPSNTDQYLTELYGNWKIPKREFDSSREECTICDTIQYREQI